MGVVEEEEAVVTADAAADAAAAAAAKAAFARSAGWGGRNFLISSLGRLSLGSWCQ